MELLLLVVVVLVVVLLCSSLYLHKVQVFIQVLRLKKTLSTRQNVTGPEKTGLIYTKFDLIFSP